MEHSPASRSVPAKSADACHPSRLCDLGQATHPLWASSPPQTGAVTAPSPQGYRGHKDNRCCACSAHTGPGERHANPESWVSRTLRTQQSPTAGEVVVIQVPPGDTHRAPGTPARDTASRRVSLAGSHFVFGMEFPLWVCWKPCGNASCLQESKGGRRTPVGAQPPPLPWRLDG